MNNIISNYNLGKLLFIINILSVTFLCIAFMVSVDTGVLINNLILKGLFIIYLITLILLFLAWCDN